MKSNYKMATITLDTKKVYNIFVLEDDITRIKWFSRELNGKFKITYTDKAETAIYLLNNNKYDIMFLDHDLGGEQMVDVKEFNTGSTVAEEINKLKIDVPVILHSFNVTGLANMKRLIPHAEILPFGTFKFEII